MCNGVEATITKDDGSQVIVQDWVDCNNPNCALSKANPDN